jgi:phytoene dehydrogenase-like protein
MFLSNIVACVTFFIMPDQCDVVIVGAGIGGLTAAAMLVKAGLRVLILEKNPHPGGTAYVYQRKGFTFPMGPLGFRTPSIVRSGGAVAGWSWNYEDCPDTRPRELVKTPMKGLYMTGYQAFSTIFMGGVPTAMESGKHASQAVLQGTGPREEIMIPVAK